MKYGELDGSGSTRSFLESRKIPGKIRPADQGAEVVEIYLLIADESIDKRVLRRTARCGTTAAAAVGRLVLPAVPARSGGHVQPEQSCHIIRRLFSG